MTFFQLWLYCTLPIMTVFYSLTISIMTVLYSLGFPGGSDGKESTCNMGDLGLIPGLGRSPGGREWQPIPVFLPGGYPWTEKPGGLQSMGSQRVRHYWMTKHNTLCQLRWGREENAVVIPVSGKVFTYNYERVSWHQSIITSLFQCRRVEMESRKLFL